MEKFETLLGDTKLIIETGKLAKLAGGSVTVRLGETIVLATATISNQPREGMDFFPLLVDFEEKMYASGKISGSRFIKREGRASESAILTSRLTDRALRPLFPKGFRNDIQVVITVLSADLINDPDALSIIAASAALSLTDAPFAGPIGSVRVGLIDEEFIINPSYEQLAESSQLDLVVAGTKDKILMVEAGAKEVDEAVIIEAIKFAHAAIKATVEIQEQLIKTVGPSKDKEYNLSLPSEELISEIDQFVGDEVEGAIYSETKKGRNEEIDKLKEAIKEKFVTEEISGSIVMDAFSEIVSKILRKNIIENNKRPDGRKLNEIRPLVCEIGMLPRPHGSSLFSRGETQALTIITLGSTSDAQMIDTMDVDDTKGYMHHYNFPPYSTGEVRPMRGPGRREIGHGALAERALLPVIPAKEDFPYTIRVVSEILASNGSSSMASICGSTLALMDAGVPIVKPVAGIAMGVITNENNFKILTDIAGIEDANGDMDFKVAGTKDGVTVLQLDMKVHGLGVEIFEEAFTQAKIARLDILKAISKCIDKPKEDLSPYAPRITVIKIDPEKIRDVIGSGGKVINDMIERAGGRNVTEINIEDDGTIYVASTNAKYAENVLEEIKNITKEAKVGEAYQGKVTRIMDFGAFVEIFPGTEGLVHISKLANYRVNKVTDIVKEGDIIPVIVEEIDSMGRVNLIHQDVKNNPRKDFNKNSNNKPKRR